MDGLSIGLRARSGLVARRSDSTSREVVRQGVGDDRLHRPCRLAAPLPTRRGCRYRVVMQMGEGDRDDAGVRGIFLKCMVPGGLLAEDLSGHKRVMHAGRSE